METKNIIPNPVNNHQQEFAVIIPMMPPGPIGEFGVYEGGSTVQLAGFGRLVYAFDTFEGMPFDAPFNEDLDWANPPGKFNGAGAIDFLKNYSKSVDSKHKSDIVATTNCSAIVTK